MCLHVYIILYFLQESFLNMTYKPCAQLIKSSLTASTYHHLKRMSTHIYTHIHRHVSIPIQTQKKNIPQSAGIAWSWSQQARMTQQFYKTWIVNTKHTPAVESIKRPLHSTTAVLPDPAWPINNEDPTISASIG